MINTNCENCVFANTESEECVFDIPNSIGGYKTITKQNNYNHIENYRCRYTLSRSVYEDLIKENHTHEQIIEFIISKVKIKYYLVVLLDNAKNSIIDLCKMLNKLCIKPKFVSFINKNLNDGNDMSDLINNNLDQDIAWKLHNMLIDLEPQECMTICMDTNFNKTGSHLFCVYDQNLHGNNYDLLNNRIAFLHTCMVLQQRHCHAIIQSLDSIDGLAMSFNAYKILIHNQNRNILKAIQTENETIPNFKYISYEHTD